MSYNDEINRVTDVLAVEVPDRQATNTVDVLRPHTVRCRRHRTSLGATAGARGDLKFTCSPAIELEIMVQCRVYCSTRPQLKAQRRFPVPVLACHVRVMYYACPPVQYQVLSTQYNIWYKVQSTRSSPCMYEYAYSYLNT